MGTDRRVYPCAGDLPCNRPAAIREAKRAKEEGKERVILFNWSGHGLMDLIGYDAYLSGKLTAYELPQAEIEKSLAAIRAYPKP